MRITSENPITNTLWLGITLDGVDVTLRGVVWADPAEGRLAIKRHYEDGRAIKDADGNYVLEELVGEVRFSWDTKHAPDAQMRDWVRRAYPELVGL